MNSEIMFCQDMLKEYSFDFVYGYMFALSSIDTPPNNGIDYKWYVDYLNCLDAAAYIKKK